MAFMNQERKKALTPAIKAVLKKYDVKGTISVKHYSTLVCTIQSSKFDFFENYKNKYDDMTYLQVNEYHISDSFSGIILEFLTELKEAMMVGNHDRSDLQSDYHDVGWYIDINIGKWDKPYILIK